MPTATVAMEIVLSLEIGVHLPVSLRCCLSQITVLATRAAERVWHVTRQEVS